MKSFNRFIINKTKLINNVLATKKQLNKGVLFCACVKANAYGLGLAQVCKILKNEADYFAVASLSEALEIRKTCPHSKICLAQNSVLFSIKILSFSFVYFILKLYHISNK